MKKLLNRLCVMLIMPMLLAGCWDIKNIQDVNYLTALGLDYEDGKYIAYGQLLDFANVAKQEGGAKPAEQASVYVGRGEGATVSQALHDIYREAQQTVFWGHLSAVVISERLLKKGIDKETFDSIIRFREIRYTQWVYVTRERIDRLLTVTPLFNLSPIASILSQPQASQKQASFIPPIRFQRFTAEFREPGNTALIPAISISEKEWKENGKPKDLLQWEGLFTAGRNRPSAFLGNEESLGIRWMETRTNRSPVFVRIDGKPGAVLICKKPKIKKTFAADEQGVGFDIGVKLKCGIQEETIIPLDPHRIKEAAEKKVRAEIETTYANGQKTKSDLYKLEHEVYRKDFPYWSKATENGTKPMANIRLRSVHVEIALTQSGMYTEMRQKSVDDF